MREDEADVAQPAERAGEEQTRHRTSRVVRQFREHVWHVGDEIAAAVRPGRVDIDDGLAAVEFLKHGHVGSVAEPPATGWKTHSSVADRFEQRALLVLIRTEDFARPPKAARED